MPQARSNTREPRGRCELADRPASPADVHPERHDPVHEVVARADRVEQPRTVARLLLALRASRSRSRPRSAASAASEQDAPEVVRHERGHGRQQLAERLDHLRGGRRRRRRPCRGSARARARRTGRRRARRARASRRRHRARAPSRSPSGRPNSSSRSAVRTSSMSPACSAPRRRRGRPIRIPSRSTAWINDAGTPLDAGEASSVERRRRRRPRSALARRRPRPGPRRRRRARRRTTRPIAARVRPLPWRSRIRRIRSACSSPYQATRPSRSGCGSSPRDW